MAELDNEENVEQHALLALKNQEVFQERVQFNRNKRGRLNHVLKKIKNRLLAEAEDTRAARDAFKLTLNTSKTKFKEAKKEEQNIKKEKRNSEHTIKTHIEDFILNMCSIQVPSHHGG